MSDVVDVLGLEKTNTIGSKAMDPHVIALTAMSKGSGTRKGKVKKSLPKPPGMSREMMCDVGRERERVRQALAQVRYNLHFME